MSASISSRLAVGGAWLRGLCVERGIGTLTDLPQTKRPCLKVCSTAGASSPHLCMDASLEQPQVRASFASQTRIAPRFKVLLETEAVKHVQSFPKVDVLTVLTDGTRD